MAQQAYAYVTLIPVAKGFQSAIAGELDGVGGVGANAGAAASAGFGGKFLSGIKSLAGPLAATFGTIGVANFLKEAVTAGSNFQAEFEGVNQVFGTGATKIQAYAREASKLAGLSENEALRAAKGFGVFAKSAGLANGEAATFSQQLVQAAGDLGSFNDVPTASVLDAIKSGLTGQSEPLRNFGIIMGQAEIEATALAMGLGEITKNGDKTTISLSEQEKVLARQQFILDNLGPAAGDFVKYQEDFGNAAKTAGAEFANLSKEIGVALLPVMTQLVNFAKDVLLPIFSGIFNFIKDNIVVISTFAGVLAGLAVAFNAVAIATGIWSAAQTLLNFVLALNPLVFVAIAIAAVVAGIVYLATQTTFFADVWKSMTTAVTTAWNAVVGFFTTTFANIGKSFAALWTGATTAWNTFSGYIKTGVQAIGDFFKPVFEGISTLFKGYVNTWLMVFESFINFFVNGINGIIGGINAVLTGIKVATGGTINLAVGKVPNVNLPRLAKGGFVSSPTTALIGEAGPEVVMPLNRFEKLMGLSDGGKAKTINYYAAPNQSLNAEQALFTAMRRADVVGAW